MKFAVIFMVSCVLFSLVPSQLAQGPSSGTNKVPVWCPDKEVFNGSCTDRGSPSQTCFLDFLGSKSASAMPKNCECTPLRKNKHLCKCLTVCNNNI